MEHHSAPSSSSATAPYFADAWITARLVEVRDGPTLCLEQSARLYDDQAILKRLVVEQPGAAAWLVRIALAAGDRRRAAQVVACSERVAGDNPTFDSLGARAAQARGLLDRDASALQRSAAAHTHPWARASAAEDTGTVLAEAGQRAGARPHFESALTGYTETGADRDAARVRARLRGVGVRHRHWNHTERPVSGWPSLTDTERAVADLVAEGLTNPQVAARMFLSRYTVDFHLRQIFRKLDVASRVELTRLAFEVAEGSSAPG
jgi:DNA-binding CsgD family transcriptional regulator